MRNIVLSVMVFVSTLAITVAQEEITTYQSEDRAVSFSYSTDWTIEDQIINFGELYRFALWTPEPNPFVPIERTRILLDFHNRSNEELVQLEAPIEFAEYALNGLSTFDEIEELTLLDSEAVRTYTVLDEQLVILYTIVLNSDWVIIASVTPPTQENRDIYERALVNILESIDFDSEAAATPFVRNLETYDISNVTLDEVYTSEDLNLSFSYSDVWELIDDSTFTNFTSNTAYFFQFQFEDIEINLQVIDVTDPGLNPSRDLDTPDEVMNLLRQSEDGIISEFRIGEFDAVSVMMQDNGEISQSIAYALNNSWITSINVAGISEEDHANIEAVVVATLESIEFAQGASYIRFPILTVDLPEPWQLGISNFENQIEYEFILRPSDNQSSNGPRILIEISNLVARDLQDIVDEDGIDGLVDLVITDDIGRDVVTIAEYHSVQSDVFSPEENLYGKYTLILLNDEWLFIAYAATFDEDAIETIQNDINIIIETMEINLPED